MERRTSPRTTCPYPPTALKTAPLTSFPGAILPSSRLLYLSRPEHESMENYIGESLAAGIIRPFSFPIGEGFFFVGKKDGSLRPCVDYRGLNDITVKINYPMPLISSAFVPLHGASVFSKLHPGGR